MEQSSTNRGSPLRESLVRGLVQQNLAQIGKQRPEAASPARPDTLPAAPARPPRQPEPVVRKPRRRSRLRIPFLLLCLGYVCVFGTSAFRQVSPGARGGKAPAAAPWNSELLDDLRVAATAPDGLPMSLAQMFQLRVGRVVIDPGHGGSDPGCRAGTGLEEKAVTLAIAKRLAPILEQKLRAEVILTRDDDTFVPLEERADRANRLEADLFVSIHLNWFPSASIQRVETYFVGLSTDQDSLEIASRENAGGQVRISDFDHVLRRMAQTLKVQESRRFAELVQSAMFDGLRKRNPKLKDRGVRRAPFVVLMGTKMPSILAEVSFLSDPEEAKRLEDPAHLQAAAESLADGIGRYLASDQTVATASAGTAAR